MLRLLPPPCWTGLIAYLGGGQWGGAKIFDCAAVGVMLRVLAALGQRRTTS